MPDHSLRQFFRLTFLISWGVGALALVLGLLTHERWFAPGTALFMVAGAGPTLAALIITARTEGIAGLKNLLRRLVPAARTRSLYLLALLAFFVIAAAAWGMTTRDIPAFYLLVGSPAFWSALPARLAVDTGPLGEELGWRGFALPRMLRTSSPWVASILLGVVWTLWHVPAFFLPDLPQRQIAFAPFALNTIALAVVFTWFYLRSGGDLLLMVLLHFLANLVAGAFGLPLWPVAVASTSLAVLAWCDPRMRAMRPGMASTQSPLVR
jgi:hypothetical protein